MLTEQAFAGHVYFFLLIHDTDVGCGYASHVLLYFVIFPFFVIFKMALLAQKISNPVPY